MCTLNIHKQALPSYIFVLLLIFNNSNGHLLKRSPEFEQSHNSDDTKIKIISEEDPRKDPGAGPDKPDTMPHSLSRRQSYASFSRLYLCKWLNPREELLSLPTCTNVGDFPYLDECRVFRHCINVGSPTVKACCPVGSHFDHILRECVHAEDARCLARDLQDQFLDSAFYEDSAVDLLPHADVVHVNDYVDDLHDDIVDPVAVEDVDDDSEPLDDSFEIIDPTVLANSDKAWKYYPAPPHLYPGAFWTHNPYTGRMEPGKYGYAMPIWMSYSVEPVQKIRPPRRRPKPWRTPWPFGGSGSHGGNRRSTEEYDPKAGLGEEDGDESDEGEASEEKKKVDLSGESIDKNDKSTTSTSPVPVTPMATPAPTSESTPTPASTPLSVVIPMIPEEPPAPPPTFVTFKPPTSSLPPVELITFTTKQPGAIKGSDEDNGFEMETSTEKKTDPNPPSEIPSPTGNQKEKAPVAWKSNEPPPPIRGIPGKSGFDDSSEEENPRGKKKRSEETGNNDHDVHQSVTQSVPESQVTPRQLEIDEGIGQSEKELSVLPDFENSIEQDAISNGDVQSTSNSLSVRSSNLAVKSNNLAIRTNERSQNNEGGKQTQNQPSPKRKRQVPMAMMRRRVIPRQTPDYFYYNY